jgi:hypothetical protein
MSEGEKSLVQKRNKARLLGLGLDNQDGEVRLTRGENFHLVGGSHETHECMQEQCIKFNERLRERGKQIEHLERKEFLDIAAECKMNVALPQRGEE